MKYIVIISFFITIGWAPVHGSNNEKAIEIQKKIAKIRRKEPSRAKAILFAELGLIQYKAGQFERAVESYNRSLSQKTNKRIRREVYLYLGKSYESSGRIDKAISAYEKAIRYDRKNWRRYRDVGRLYEYVKLYDKAIESYASALRFRAKKPELYLAVGRCWRKKGFYVRAEEHLQKVRSLEYTQREFFRELSLVQEGKGNFKDALLSQEKSLHDQSLLEDWLRLVYLAVLSKNKTFANKGMDHIRTQNPDQETMEFYETLVHYSEKGLTEVLNQNKSEPTIGTLIQFIHENAQSNL